MCYTPKTPRPVVDATGLDLPFTNLIRGSAMTMTNSSTPLSVPARFFVLSTRCLAYMLAGVDD
jgi:hypothetical protein